MVDVLPLCMPCTILCPHLSPHTHNHTRPQLRTHTYTHTHTLAIPCRLPPGWSDMPGKERSNTKRARRDWADVLFDASAAVGPDRALSLLVAPLGEMAAPAPFDWRTAELALHCVRCVFWWLLVVVAVCVGREVGVCACRREHDGVVCPVLPRQLLARKCSCLVSSPLLLPPSATGLHTLLLRRPAGSTP